MLRGLESGAGLSPHLLCPLSSTPAGAPCLVLPALDASSLMALPELPGSCLALASLLPLPLASLVCPQNGRNLSGFWTLIRQWGSCCLPADDQLLPGSLQVASLLYVPSATPYSPVPPFLHLLTIPLLLSSGLCWLAGAVPDNCPPRPELSLTLWVPRPQSPHVEDQPSSPAWSDAVPDLLMGDGQERMSEVGPRGHQAHRSGKEEEVGIGR